MYDDDDDDDDDDNDDFVFFKHWINNTTPHYTPVKIHKYNTNT
jgi:hypothetical protein